MSTIRGAAANDAGSLGWQTHFQISVSCGRTSLCTPLGLCSARVSLHTIARCSCLWSRSIVDQSRSTPQQTLRGQAHPSTMPSMMAGVAFSVLLVTAALQQTQAALWVPDWLSVSPLDNIQRLMQQRQQRKLRSTPAIAAVSAAVPSELAVAPLRRQLLQADEAGSYGGYGYGYGYGEYGYGYGDYAYGSSEPGIELSSTSQGRQEAATQSGLAPTLVYTDSEQPATAAAVPSGSSSNSRRLSQVIEAGLAHSEGIELSDVASTAAVPAVSFELSSERRAARKLLLAASKLSVGALDAAVAPLAPVVLEPQDALLPGSGRALLSMGEGSYGGSYGGYGEYGYGEYGYGDYGYGGYGAAQAAAFPANGRALLEAAEDSDVTLYQVWLASHAAQRAH
ncbi:hypothetical protein COO60DRAFT_3245 [Scenedesmus sp. NREL 46B-D3]|nr:hypothetical protein COO60DRAFT_3245 [Scenedesmus sp. NREL 46B-D3]